MQSGPIHVQHLHHAQAVHDFFRVAPEVGPEVTDARSAQVVKMPQDARKVLLPQGDGGVFEQAAEALFALSQRSLGLAALRDVAQHGQVARGLAGLLQACDAGVEIEHAPILVHGSEVAGQPASGVRGYAAQRRGQPLPVVSVRKLKQGLAEHFLRAAAQLAAQAGIDKGQLAGAVGATDASSGVLHQPLVLLLAEAQGVLRALALLQVALLPVGAQPGDQRQQEQQRQRDDVEGDGPSGAKVQQGVDGRAQRGEQERGAGPQQEAGREHRYGPNDQHTVQHFQGKHQRHQRAEEEQEPQASPTRVPGAIQGPQHAQEQQHRDVVHDVHRRA